MTAIQLTTLLLLTIVALGIAEEPHLDLLPKQILKALDEGVYVACDAKVDDVDLVTEMHWINPNGETIPNSDLSQERVNVLDEGRAGKLDLIITKLRDQDVGEYQCRATYAGNIQLSANVTVHSFMDIDFGDTPQHQTPLLYTQAKIQCNPQARPAPRVDWLKDMVALKNSDQHIIHQDGILINNVSLADEGTYRCRARVPQLGSIKFRDIQVEVYIPPVITVAPQDQKGIEKESITLHCRAEGKPAPHYTWVDMHNSPLHNTEGYYIDEDTGSLTILSITAENNGVYTCNARNNAGDVMASAELQVLTKPKIESFLNITIPADSPADLSCTVSGSPVPEVLFQKEGNAEPFVSGINADDRIKVEQEVDEEGRMVGRLKIRELSRSDDGLYTCTGKSEGGVTQAWGHITVEFPPTFEEQVYKEMWSWEQNPVNLTCLATSIPNATIEWYLRNQEIDPNDPNMRVMALGPLGVLQVTPLSASYFGDYTCQATNTLGTATWDIELKEAHVPGPVADAKVDKLTATTITWSLTDPADNGGLPIQGYIVEYRIQDTHWEDGGSKFWTKGSTYTIDGLLPMTTYVFRFAARSDAGTGEWGGEESVDMPKHAAPEEPLIFNTKPGVTEIPYPDRFTLQWSVPLDNGKEIDMFQIIYYQVQNVSGKWSIVGDTNTQTVTYPGPSTYTLTHLHTHTHYKIELRAHNEIGFSTPAEVIIKTAMGAGVSGSESGEGGIGTPVLITIIIVVIVVLLITMDVMCYVMRRRGCIAAVLRKREDKEAILEAKSADTLNEEKEGVKNEKIETEKSIEKKSSEIKLELEPEDKQEGNGVTKTAEEHKEPAEPTESTPMIQGDKEDKEAIIKEEQDNKQQQEEELKKSESKSSITKDSPV